MTGYGDGLYGDGLYGGSVGVEYLTNVLSDSRIAVEIAWGADLNADPDTWSWTDVTSDVRTEQGIETSMGRADEASTSQPASCSFTLDNSTGDYSLGGQSRLYPNVRRNTPVRVRVDPDGTGFDVVFQGFADGFTPSWNLTGTVREVQVSASGVLRRLIQGSSPLVSSLRRGLTDQPDTIAYWPCEEGKSASVITPVAGSQEMTFTGSPKFETSTVFDSSAPLPELNGAVFTGIVDPYTDTGRSQVRMLLAFPSEDAAPDGTALFQVFTTGSVARWDVLYKTSGNFQLIAYDRFNSALYTSSTIGFGVNGSGRFYSFEMIQDGSDIDWTVGTLTPYIPLGSTNGTVTGQTVGTVSRIVVNPSGLLTDVGFGHAIVQNDVTNRYGTQKQLDANRGDWAFQRAARLCDENNVLFSVLGDGIGGSGTTSIADGMGPQSIDTLVNLLRECEAVDQGVLFDGVTDGLILYNRYYNENRAASLTVSAENAKLASGFGPIDDDQRNRNRVEAKRSNGSSAVFEDRDGPLGTESIGIYDSSVTLNALRDDAMPLYAGWLVALGTIEGYRYPTLTVDLLATPELAPDWLSVQPGSRIDVTGLDAVLPGHPVGTLSLLVEGVSNSFTGDTWTGTAKCSLYEPWRIGVVSEESGDADEYLLRLLSDGSTLVSDVSAGSTSISVGTPSGPLWTTDPDDFPLVIEIGGVTATVTSIAGASSPQTFTITDLGYDKSTGAEVTVHQPTRLGL